MNGYVWYESLIKPAWAPPAFLFGPVWTVLYLLIGVSFGFVFYQYIQGTFPSRVVVPFVLNVFFNIAFTPVQFWLQNNLLAAIDVVLVLATLLWGMIVVYRYARWISLINIPYLLWVSFATILQITITYLNW